MFFIQDPRPEPRPGMVVYAHSGFIREDGTKKPAYPILVDFLESLQTNCSSQTNSDGVLTFAGNPGIYEIRIGGTFKKQLVHLTGDGPLTMMYK